jgi:hypothetical protein
MESNVHHGSEQRVWESLRSKLIELEADVPSPLQSYPSPERQLVAPPFEVNLAPWAIEIAKELKSQFGDYVVLTVGALRYPTGELCGLVGAPMNPPVPYDEPIASDDEVAVTVADHLQVRSGYELQAELQLANRLDSPVTVEAGTSIYGRILDPATGEVVGGFMGARRLALVSYEIKPTETITIPLVVGTASFKRSLGYSVPPGKWAIEAALLLVGRGRRRTPTIPLTIVA